MHMTVSVVIPNHNRLSQLRSCLASILAQTHPVSEVIIVDDCSDEKIYSDVQSLVAEFASLGLAIRMVRNQINKGANYSRNRGVELAQGELIAFIDSDDAWLPEKLRLQLQAIQHSQGKHKPWVLSATGRYRVDAKGVIICIQASSRTLTPQTIRVSNFIGTLSSVLVHKAAVLAIGGFDEKLGAGQDWDLFIRLCEQVDYVSLPEPLLIYVDHEEPRITLNTGKRLRAHMRIFSRHIRSYGMHKLDMHEFYRILAEDYQGVGNRRRAEHFYARSIDNAIPVRLLRQRFYFPIRWWLCFAGLADVRAQRYHRYQAQFERQARKLGIKSLARVQAEIGDILSASSTSCPQARKDET